MLWVSERESVEICSLFFPPTKKTLSSFLSEHLKYFLGIKLIFNSKLRYFLKIYKKLLNSTNLSTKKMQQYIFVKFHKNIKTTRNCHLHKKVSTPKTNHYDFIFNLHALSENVKKFAKNLYEINSAQFLHHHSLFHNTLHEQERERVPVIHIIMMCIYKYQKKHC